MLLTRGPAVKVRITLEVAHQMPHRQEIKGQHHVPRGRVASRWWARLHPPIPSALPKLSSWGSSCPILEVNTLRLTEFHSILKIPHKFGKLLLRTPGRGPVFSVVPYPTCPSLHLAGCQTQVWPPRIGRRRRAQHETPWSWEDGEKPGFSHSIELVADA